MIKYTVDINDYINGTGVTPLYEVKEISTARSYKPRTPIATYRAPVASPIPIAMYTVVAFAIAAMLCYTHISLWNDISSYTKSIAVMEAQLSDLAKSNNEECARINSKIDLEAIRETALNDLHMVYPTNDQTVTYTDVADDYVMQYRDFYDN